MSNLILVVFWLVKHNSQLYKNKKTSQCFHLKRWKLVADQFLSARELKIVALLGTGDQIYSPQMLLV